jgi:hypothetical protein
MSYVTVSEGHGYPLAAYNIKGCLSKKLVFSKLFGLVTWMLGFWGENSDFSPKS